MSNEATKETSAADRILAKLGRAREHSEEFLALRGEFIATHQPAIERQQHHDDEARVWEDTFVVASVDATDLELSLVAGDCVQNARSCLDHLVYALWEKNRGGPLREQEERRPAFPIVTVEAKFAKEAKYHLAGVAPEVRTVIESVQPYNRTPKALPPWPEVEDAAYTPDRHPLAVLEALSIRDKHRLPNLTVIKVVGHTYFEPPAGGTLIGGSTGALTVGHDLGTWRYDESPRHAGTEADILFMWDLAFAQGPPSVWPARAYLRSILDFIDGEVLPRLLQYL